MGKEPDIHACLEDVRAKARLEEGVSVIERLLIQTYHCPGISKKLLARHCALPIPVAVALCNELKKAGLLGEGSGMNLTSRGRSLIEDDLAFKGVDQELYRRAVAGALTPAEILQRYPFLQEIFSERPQVDVTLDQSKCLAETSIRRALLCLRYNSLLGKNILCVGDDDLVSVALGMLLHLLHGGHTRGTRIQVFEIDRRFTEYLGLIAQRHALPIQCACLDLRSPPPQQYVESFDCFFSDPPYTLEGLNLFLSRGIACLRRTDGLPIFLSFAQRSPDSFLQVQNALGTMGLAFAEMLPAFNSYEGAEMLANSSQMLVLRTTHKTSPALTQAHRGPLYTGELRRTRRVYRCQACSRDWPVGSAEAFTTIEELKRQGCPSCHGLDFELKERKKENADED